MTREAFSTFLIYDAIGIRNELNFEAREWEIWMWTDLKAGLDWYHFDPGGWTMRYDVKRWSWSKIELSSFALNFNLLIVEIHRINIDVKRPIKSGNFAKLLN